MIIKLSLHELRKDIKLIIPVILQLACALILIIACVSSVTSRFKYYKPFSEMLEKDGCVAVIGTVSPYRNTELKEMLKGCEDVSLSYNMAAGSGIASPTVYDDKIMECYPLEMLSGEWVVSAPDKQYPQIMVSANTKYKKGDLIETNLGFTFEVAGIFKDSQKLFVFNNMVAKYSDYRLFFAEDDEKTERVIMSRSEADKCDAACYPSGLGFISYGSVSDDENVENSITLMEYGAVGTFLNSDVRNNSKTYIYDQLYTLLPILICVSILLLVSILSVNSIVTVKRLRFYSVYQICGLTSRRCSLIAVIKAIFISAFSSGICFLMFIIKEKTNFLNSFILDFGAVQMLCCLVYLILNIIISYIVCRVIITKNELNQILKEN